MIWNIYITPNGRVIASTGIKVTSTYDNLFKLLELLRFYGSSICLYDDHVYRGSLLCTFTSSEIAAMPSNADAIKDYVYANYPEYFV